LPLARSRVHAQEVPHFRVFSEGIGRPAEDRLQFPLSPQRLASLDHLRGVPALGLLLPKAKALGAEFLRRVRQLQRAQPLFIAILVLERFARVTAQVGVVLVGKAEGPVVRVAALDLPFVFAMHPESGMIAQLRRRGPHDVVAPDRVIGVVAGPGDPPQQLFLDAFGAPGRHHDLGPFVDEQPVHAPAGQIARFLQKARRRHRDHAPVFEMLLPTAWLLKLRFLPDLFLHQPELCAEQGRAELLVVLPEVVLPDLKRLEDYPDMAIVEEDGGEIAPDPIDDGFAAGKPAVILDVRREPVNAQAHGLEGVEFDLEKHPCGHDRVPEEILQHGLGDAKVFGGIGGDQDVHGWNHLTAKSSKNSKRGGSSSPLWDLCALCG